MKQFVAFLIEETEKHPETGQFKKPTKHIVMTFGRMSPPHAGHMLVVNKVRKIADKLGADHKIIVSHSHDNKKNPLPPHRKLGYVRSMAPKGTRVVLSSKASPSLLAHAKQAHKDGYTDLHVVVGGDRVKPFKTMLNKYNGSDYKFNSITVHSAGARRGKDALKVSATGQRKAASEGDLHTFSAGLPKGYPHVLAKRMMKDVARGLK